MTSTTTDERQVWIGCLACYNAGDLVGEWVDATEAADYVPCTGRGHEEFWVMDHQGFDGAILGECSPVEAQAIAEKLDELDYVPPGAFVAWCQYHGHRIADADERDCEEDYQGEWSSFRDYAEDLAESSGLLTDNPSWPYTCIDWEHAARELEYDYWTAEAPDGVYVFNRF